MSAVTFGDNVYIIDTSLTRELGLAGEHGVVYGVTVPLVCGVAVIGTSSKDAALNVHFESRNEAFWFVPELVEFVDHGAGTEITLKGVDKKWVRRDDGGWDELSTAPKRS
jgi:hypothetical protein